ncbi:MFS transporter [Bifidobacterium leontopitheci]|uniref:MFS transporter n=1 Tax=Bifidobacterium leontopitheci TaxID=2650774 RepID=A0A6I1GAK5_9BIFI|nr:hypothetical protein [Bifidobacterium leontopitheci]KAB7788703.1 hypothetical protein F7D09_2098 [Bifidobacterium leontopitheci]
MSNRTYWGFIRNAVSGPLLGASCIARAAAGLLPYGITVYYIAKNEYALAGIVSAVMMIASSLTSGVRGRIVEQYSPRIALIAMAAVNGVTALMTIGIDSIPSENVMVKYPVEMLCAIGSGISLPPVSAVIRDVWNTITDDQTENMTLHSLDSILEEAVFSITPFITSTLWLFMSPVVGVVAGALLGVLGNAIIVICGIQSTSRVRELFSRRSMLKPVVGMQKLWQRSYWFRGAWALLIPQYGVGFGLSALTLLLPKVTESLWGNEAFSGYLLSAISISGVLATMVWGKMHLKITQAKKYMLLSVAICISNMIFLSIPFVGNGIYAGLLLIMAVILYGSAMSPMFVTAYTWIDLHVNVNNQITANTMLGGAYNLGDGCSSIFTGVIAASPLCVALPVVCAVVIAAELPAGCIGYVDRAEKGSQSRCY